MSEFNFHFIYADSSELQMHMMINVVIVGGMVETIFNKHYTFVFSLVESTLSSAALERGVITLKENALWLKLTINAVVDLNHQGSQADFSRHFSISFIILVKLHFLPG